MVDLRHGAATLMGGVWSGWMLIAPFFPFCFVYVLPGLGLLAAKWSKPGGVILSGLGLGGWIVLTVINEGFVIDAFLSDRKIFASGLIAGLIGSAALTLAPLLKGHGPGTGPK
jgi:hypothetical protein